MKTKTVLKSLIFFLAVVFSKNEISAQSFNHLDESPHDISYYRLSKVTPPLVKVIYGRPQKKGQEVFGNLVTYGKLWKTGANEATEVKFYEDILFGDVKVPAGTYVLLTVPGEKEWEIILSSNLDVWGAFQYNQVFDVAKIIVPSSKSETLEAFSIVFEEKNDNIQMVLGWDSTRVRIPIVFKSKELYAKL